MVFLPRDFKSLASTNFATRAASSGWLPVVTRCQYMIVDNEKVTRARKAQQKREKLEAGVGIEPAYTELQSAA